MAQREDKIMECLNAGGYIYRSENIDLADYELHPPVKGVKYITDETLDRLIAKGVIEFKDATFGEAGYRELPQRFVKKEQAQ